MYAHINGIKLYFDVDGAEYEVSGRELRHKPACFAIHGGPGGNHVAFKPYLDELKQTMQLIYIDQRGSGFSEEADPDTYTMEQNVEDIESLRQYLGLEKIWILGHSYGGMVAQSYAAQYEQNLYGLLIVTSAATGKFLALAKKFVETHGTTEQIAISEKLWAGDFQSDEEVAEFYRLMGPFYSVKVQKEGTEPRPDTKRSY
ncbi:proline-specific peptidase [Natribacillus halophilus]|uniref:Proline-specific peptidase n=1 Tax=Natribacillus halophilus TaxID=549003 RepID=A0A1G8PF71_9BACI|nr:alpha/beta fold hydrolase [Natribacillus halophilus]SDI91211.1 proline-specific peptidase [Natribacillus halophilus]